MAGLRYHLGLRCGEREQELWVDAGDQGRFTLTPDAAHRLKVPLRGRCQVTPQSGDHLGRTMITTFFSVS